MSNVFMIILGLAASGGSSASPQYVITQLPEGVFYDGKITPQGAKELIKNTKPGSVLSIRSTGGNERAALDIGEHVLQNNIYVKLVDYCMSSCANAVVASASGRLNVNDAIIAYHWSVVHAHGLQVKAGWPISDEFEDSYQRYKLLYKKSNVDINLLIDAGDKSGIKISKETHYDPVNSKATVLVRYEAVIATNGFLRKNGINFTGGEMRACNKQIQKYYKSVDILRKTRAVCL